MDMPWAFSTAGHSFDASVKVHSGYINHVKLNTNPNPCQIFFLYPSINFQINIRHHVSNKFSDLYLQINKIINSAKGDNCS